MKSPWKMFIPNRFLGLYSWKCPWEMRTNPWTSNLPWALLHNPHFWTGDRFFIFYGNFPLVRQESSMSRFYKRIFPYQETDPSAIIFHLFTNPQLLSNDFLGHASYNVDQSLLPLVFGHEICIVTAIGTILWLGGERQPATESYQRLQTISSSIFWEHFHKPQNWPWDSYSGRNLLSWPILTLPTVIIL